MRSGTVARVTLPISTEAAISVVVPVYNGSETIAELVERLGAVLSSAALAYEVILVDDGSTDGSWHIAQNLAQSGPHVRGLRLGRNYGQENAVLAGIRSANYPLTVTLDDDLQNRPEDIPQLLAALDDNTDLVYGVAENPGSRSVSKRIGKWVVRHAAGDDTDAGSGESTFRLFRTRLRDASAKYEGPYTSVDVLLAWATGKIRRATVQRDPRRHGKSGYTFAMLCSFAVSIVTGFGISPLVWLGLLGVAVMLVGGLALAFSLVWSVTHGAIHSIWILFSFISVVSGLNLFAVGALGQYVGRVHFNAMRRPSYTVVEEVGNVSV